jgi:hypothetical protein
MAITIVYAVSLSAAAVIAFAIILLLGNSMYLLIVLKMFKARGLVHLGWCIYCIIMIIGFVLGTILNPVSVISVEFCDYLDGFLHNKAYFENSKLVAYIVFYIQCWWN